VERLDAFLAFNDRAVLADAGRISHAVAEQTALSEFSTYDTKRRELGSRESASDLDAVVDSVRNLEPPPPIPEA